MGQRALKEGRRARISVSLDAEDYDWVQSFKGPSESYTVSRIVKAARLAGLTLEEAKSGGVLEEFAEFLSKKKRNKLAADMHALIEEYLELIC